MRPVKIEYNDMNLDVIYNKLGLPQSLRLGGRVVTFKYDKNNIISYVQTIYDNGSTSSVTIEYDDKYRIISKTITCIPNDGRGIVVITSFYEYDDNGYISFIKDFLDHRIYVNDDEGRVLKFVKLNNDGSFEVEDVAEFKYENNQLVEYKDSDGNYWEIGLTSFIPHFPFMEQRYPEYPMIEIMGANLESIHD